jgi:PAS domain S-box-containing protein
MKSKSPEKVNSARTIKIQSKTISILTLIIVFTIDLIVPPGAAVGVLYLIPMAIAINESQRMITVVAALASILIVVDVAIHVMNGHDYALRWTEYSDRILALMAVFIMLFILIRYRRLNEEKFRQQELVLEKEKLYHKLVDNLIEGAQLIGPDWKYVYVNDSLVKHSGYASREDLINRRMMEVYPGIEKTELFKKLEFSMKERVPDMFDNEFNYPDGSKGYFKLSVEPVEEGLFILTMDISERKKKENNRKQYIKDLEEIIFIISHKVRQPIAHILGLASVLKDGQNKEEVKNIVTYIKESAGKLDDFTNEPTMAVAKSQKANHISEDPDDD